MVDEGRRELNSNNEQREGEKRRRKVRRIRLRDPLMLPDFHFARVINKTFLLNYENI